MPRKTEKSKDNTAIIVAIIAGAATLITAIIGLAMPFVDRLAGEIIQNPPPSLAPEPAVSPDNIIFMDDFSTNKGIPVWSDERSFGEIVDGIFRFGVTSPNLGVWRSYKDLEVSDFRLRADINMPISTKVYSCGIMFRANNKGDYLFGINNDNRYEFIKRTINEANELTGTTLINWAANMAIKTHGVNTIEIIAEQDTLELFVNDVKVDTIVDSTHQKGNVGFYVSTYGGGQEAIVEFDNLIIEER